MVNATAAVVLLVVLFPAFWLLQMSFRTGDDIFDMRLVFAPTLENYRALVDRAISRFARQQRRRQPRRDGAVAAARRARRLCRCRAGGSAAGGQWRLWILATRMAPPIAFTIPFFLAYRLSGCSTRSSGLIMIYLTFNLALVIWMMRNFFDGVPRALEEAAWIDGCGVWSAFRRIALPLAAPGLAATGVLCFILSWNDFFYALILTRTNAMTAPVAIVNFMQYEGWEWGKIAAGGTLVMLPVVCCSAFWCATTSSAA